INFGTGEINKPKDYPARSWDDTGNADRFMDRFGDLIRYSFIDSKFYVYEQGVWQKDDMGQVRQLIDAMIEDMRNEKISISEDMDPDEVEEVEKAWRKFISNTRNNSKKRAIVDELKHRVGVRHDEFDSNDMLLNADNGYVDLSSGELLPHEISKMFSRQASSEYTDKGDTPGWDRFLDDIFDSDKGVIKYMLKAVWYAVTGSTKEQVMFVLVGSGRNGTSISVEIISDILGRYARNIRAESLMVRQQSGVNCVIAA